MSQVNQPFPALAISFLTVAKRLYLIVLGFFSPVLGASNRFLPAHQNRDEKVISPVISSLMASIVLQLRENSPSFRPEKNARIDPFAVDLQPAKASP
jgi:hypothetical protein